MNLAAMYALSRTPADPQADAHRRDLAKAIGATCRNPGCTEPSKAKGLCENHYRAEVRTGRRCAKCDHLMTRTPGEPPSKFAQRVYCSKSCATKAGHDAASAKAAARAATLVEDVEWLLGTDTAESIARRLGYTNPLSLHRQLERLGRCDLARHFDTAAVAA